MTASHYRYCVSYRNLDSKQLLFQSRTLVQSSSCYPRVDRGGILRLAYIELDGSKTLRSTTVAAPLARSLIRSAWLLRKIKSKSVCEKLHLMPRHVFIFFVHLIARGGSSKVTWNCFIISIELLSPCFFFTQLRTFIR